MTFFEVDPSSVTAGGIPLVMTGLLAVAMVFLFRSMLKQLRRIEVSADDSVQAPSEPASTLGRVQRDGQPTPVDSTRE